MDWNLIFSAIMALCALVGLGAILHAVKQFKFSTWLKAQEIFMDSDFREARGAVLSHYWQKDKEWTDDDKEKKRRLVCARMDELARLIPYIKEKTVLYTWDDPMGKCWDVLKNFVSQEQKKTKWDAKWKAFSIIGQKALDRVKEREKRYKEYQDNE